MANVKTDSQKKKLASGKTKTYTNLRWSVKVNGKTKRFINGTGLNKIQRRRVLTILDELENDNFVGSKTSPQLMEKIHQLDGGFLSKLQKIGLVEPDDDQKLLELDNFLAYVIEKKEQLFASNAIVEDTLNKCVYTCRHFLDFMQKEKSADYDIRKITVEDCKNYRDSRLEKCANSTVGTEIKHLKSFFEHAIDRDQITRNPFSKVIVKRDRTAEEKRRLIIPHVDRQRAYDAIPRKTARHKNYAVYYALLNHTGCRASEPLLLKWKHVDFETARLTMPAPKTAKAGIRERKMPLDGLFADLSSILQEHFYFQDRPSGESFVVRDLMHLPETGGMIDGLSVAEINAKGIGRTPARMNQKNLATRLKDWASAAGIEVWPRFRQNLRVSRENELLQAGEYRTEAVHVFIGHSGETFKKSYAVINEDDYTPFSERQSNLCHSANLPPFNGDNRKTTVDSTSEDIKKDPPLAGLVVGCDEISSPKAPRVGLEPTT